MQLLTWWTSQLVMGSLDGGPACVIGKYSNKDELLKSYSFIQLTGKTWKLFPIQTLFLSFKSSCIAKHITAGYERVTVYQYFPYQI